MTLLPVRASIHDRAAFVAAYGTVYEHSPWVAETAWDQHSDTELDTLDGLIAAMRDIVDSADEARKMVLICAHPDLAGKAAVHDELTVESLSEQRGAGLDQCTAEEFEDFQTLNAAYKLKFGFPFIIAVKGHDRHSILAAFRARTSHTREQEFHTALEQIHRIAGFRLAALI